MAKTPIAVNLVCCEKMIVEEGSRNLTLVNCFVRRTVAAFPTNGISFLVFAILTDGQGEMPLEVVISHLESAQEIFRHERIIKMDSPLQQLGSQTPVRNCVFPVAGFYDVTLNVNRELVAHCKLHVSEGS